MPSLSTHCTRVATRIVDAFFGKSAGKPNNRKPMAWKPGFDALEAREVPATLSLPETTVPWFTASFLKTLPNGSTVQVSSYPLAGGNFLGTLDGTALKASYCVDIDQDIYVAQYKNASVTNNGMVYGHAVRHADQIAWLIKNLGPAAATADQQDALQAAIWKVEYGANFDLDGVDNDNAAPSVNARIAQDYRADLLALGAQTAPLDGVKWIAPGANPNGTQGQALVALSSKVEIPALNKKILAWIQTKVKTRVGGGECTHLIAEALRANGGVFQDSGRTDFNDPNYSWGTLQTTIYYLNGQAFRTNVKDLNASSTLDNVLPGDIIQYVKGGKAVHAGVVVKVDDKGWPTELYEQNVGGDRRVFDMKRDLHTFAGGDWINVYRPVARPAPAPGTYQFSVVNNTKSPVTISFLVDKTPVSFVPLTTSNTTYSYSVGTLPAGSPKSVVKLVVTIGTGKNKITKSVALKDGKGYEVFGSGKDISIRQLAQ